MSSPFPNIPPDNKYNGPGSKNNIPRVTSEKVFQTQEEKTIVFQAVKTYGPALIYSVDFINDP